MQTLCIQQIRTSTVIAVDSLNNALRKGASMNATALNALELLAKQNQCPFDTGERVPLIHPDTLEIVFVRRQHIGDCELAGH
ncbi:hypothetical protein PHMEG_00032621 [Phytophthora megakarya]|uniref:Uncharacterized protein n=1 Tax=Phytophthora megakarya TaxID=4795 RepID=A0A225UW09_9STRA|nr:hypothetical protein PHMEG_00032621 [Phytophthora megakarya]